MGGTVAGVGDRAAVGGWRASGRLGSISIGRRDGLRRWRVEGRRTADGASVGERAVVDCQFTSSAPAGPLDGCESRPDGEGVVVRSAVVGGLRVFGVGGLRRRRDLRLGESGRAAAAGRVGICLVSRQTQPGK